MRRSTLALLAWASTIAACAPVFVASATWVRLQVSDYATNRILERIQEDAARRALIANADAGIREGEAWLAAHPQ